MALIVEKFGGSSVANSERVKHVANIVAADYKRGDQVVMVVSAQGDTTDLLLKRAGEISSKASKRELDALMATGEQASAALMAIALEKLECPAVSLCGWQIGIETDCTYGNARILSVDTARLKAELAAGRIPVVAGFQGINSRDDITTIGRGGSDTTAVALAAALNADACKIYTDVDGVYSADPRDVKTAVKLYEIDYDEMLELATLGAKVLHNRAVEMAKRNGVKLEVLSSFQNHPGTKVREVTMEQKSISSVARDADVAAIRVNGLKTSEGKTSRLFSLLADKKINVDMVFLQEGEGISEVCFTVAQNNTSTVVEILCEHQEELMFEGFQVEEGVCKVSVVGLGMSSSAGVAAGIFEALYKAGIPVKFITTSEIKVSILVNEEDGVKAAVAIHDLFF